MTTPNQFRDPTTSPPAVEGPIARAVAAFREGHEAPPPRGGTGPSDADVEKQLSAYLHGRLTRADSIGLGRVGTYREQALTLARSGSMDEAEATMKAAGFVLATAGFSPLGRAAADTLQRAAESFLYYRRGEYAEAAARMSASIDATNRLAAAWGESPFSVGRRTHLLHNLMKVQLRAGNAREAMALGTGLLAHLGGMSASQPLGATGDETAPVPALEAEIATNFCNLIAGTVAELLATVEHEEARRLLGRFDGTARGGSQPAGRAWEWLVLKSIAVAGDPARYLDAAVPFLRAGRGRAPLLWWAVVLDVVRAAGELDPTGTAEGVEELVEGLRNAPRLPDSLRPAESYAG